MQRIILRGVQRPILGSLRPLSVSRIGINPRIISGKFNIVRFFGQQEGVLPSHPTGQPLQTRIDAAHSSKKKPVTVDVELPDVLREKRQNRRYLVYFGVFMVVCLFAIVKYEDANAPVVTSTLYTLRRSQLAREALGDNIQFSSVVPWVSGTISPIRGAVDFSYNAKGDKAAGSVSFKSHKSPVNGRFLVNEWSVTLENGHKISLIDEDYIPFMPGKNEEPTSRPNEIQL